MHIFGNTACNPVPWMLRCIKEIMQLHKLFHISNTAQQMKAHPAIVHSRLGVLPHQCQQLKRNWHLPRKKNQIEIKKIMHKKNL